MALVLQIGALALVVAGALWLHRLPKGDARSPADKWLDDQGW